MKDLKRIVEVKKEELDDLKRYRGEVMIVKNKSTDQEIDYEMGCYSDDPFYIVEEKLYKKFKRYRERKIYFYNENNNNINNNKNGNMITFLMNYLNS